MKERSIRKNTALLMRSHPQVRTVGQDLTVGELTAENILVLIGKKLDFAAGPLPESRNDLHRMFPLRIPGKKRDLPDPIESCLYQNGSGSTSGAEKRHFLANDIKTGVLAGLHITDPVGGVAREDAVFVQNGIHRTGDLSGRA